MNNTAELSALKTARALLNKQTFGTAEYDAAFDAVRAITRRMTDRPVTFVHTSVDGDIFAPRA